MPSKVELKQQVKDLTKKLREATKECIPEQDTIQMSGKMIEIPLTKEGKAMEPEHEGNPITCATELKKIESDIAGGKTYWNITDEQYDRWARGADACLPCERSYTETKSALTGIGISHSGVIHPEDLILEDIAASVREQTAREISAAEWGIRELEATCGIKFTRVRNRITAMKPLAHIGRWNEFMNNQRQLLKDFELDMREIIPDIKVRAPSYTVPAPVRELKEIIPKLSEYERKQLAETLTPQEQAQLEETKRLVEQEEKRLKGGA